MRWFLTLILALVLPLPCLSEDTMRFKIEPPPTTLAVKGYAGVDVVTLAAYQNLIINVPNLLAYFGANGMGSFQYKTVEIQVPKGTKVTIKELGD